MMNSWQPGTLPPIGFECEIAEPIYNAGTKVRVLCHDDGAAVCRVLEGDKLHSLCQLEISEIRPLRTEIERMREEAGKALFQAINWNNDGHPVSESRMEDYRKAFDAIAAGKIPHITLK